MKVLSSRVFNQDVSQAKRLANEQPVFVTDRGKPTHVLLSFSAFQEMVSPRATFIEQIAMVEPVVLEPDWRLVRDWRG